jgi:hypothetical protein
VRTAVVLLALSAAMAACSRESSKPQEAPSATPPPVAPYASAPGPVASPAPSAPPPAASEVAVATPKSTVKLLDPGREPRRALRYAWRADPTEHMAIDLSTTVSAEGGGMHRDVPLPPLHVSIAITPKQVTQDGDLRFAWHVESSGVGTDAGTDPAIAQGWSVQLTPVEHLAGTSIVSTHGVSRGVSIDAGSTGDAGPDAEMVVQIVQLLRDAAAPLPDEAVGAGARWQKISTLDARSGHATQTDTYTLASIEGDGGAGSGRLDDVLAQTASPQAVPSLQGLPPTEPAKMDQLLTSGTAKVRFDLGRLVAQTSLDGTTSMAVTAPSARMNMVMHLGIVVKGTTP